MPFLYRIAALLAVLTPLFAAPVNAQAPERRFALVIGNSEYKAGRLPTAANDAGLIAETLRTAGFDVAGARDLDQDTLRRSIREFLDKVSAAGPQAVTFVYLAGYGVQFEGENYIVPIDASIRRDEDIPIEAIRISDFTRPLAGTPGTVKLFILDAARQHPFTPAGPPLASGLALVEPDPGTLVAFNAAPGSIAPIESGPYGAFAQALAEMIGTGGLGLDDLFARLRLRVNEKTNGVAVPWYASKIERPFLFMERTADAPPPPQVATSMQLQSQPIREFRGDQEAYVAALERDTLGGYEEFVAAFPDSPLAARVRALIAVRREAITWRRTVSVNTPEAYWSYLERYPQGAHVPDAERRLARLAAAYDPPPAFTPMAYADVGPPPPDEVVYLSQPAIVFDGPGFYPPPPIPVFFLPPPPPAFLVLEPPPPPIGAFFLPVPVVAFFVDRPWGRPPGFVQTPPQAPMQRITINNTTITNTINNTNTNIINNTTITNNRGPGGGAGVAAAAAAPALPGSVVKQVNAGALKAPAVAAAAPTPIKAAALTGTGTLGQPTPPPSPHVGRTPAAATTTNAPPAGGPATATTTPGGSPGGQSPLGVVRPTGPNTATTGPGGQPERLISPGNTRPATGPNTAITTPGGQPGSGPQGQPTQGGRRLEGPSTATTTPGPSGPAPGATPPTPAVPQINRPVTPPPRTPQVVNRPPPAAERFTPPPATRNAPPPPAARVAPPPPPPAARIAPPPPAARVTPPPPPPAAHIAPPPPVARVAPPPPPPAARIAPPPPPPPVARVAPPPPQAVARPAPPPAAAKKCVVENGRQVCR